MESGRKVQHRWRTHSAGQLSERVETHGPLGVLRDDEILCVDGRVLIDRDGGRQLFAAEAQEACQV